MSAGDASASSRRQVRGSSRATLGAIVVVAISGCFRVGELERFGLFALVAQVGAPCSSRSASRSPRWFSG